MQVVHHLVLAVLKVLARPVVVYRVVARLVRVVLLHLVFHLHLLVLHLAVVYHRAHLLQAVLVALVPRVRHLQVLPVIQALVVLPALLHQVVV